MSEPISLCVDCVHFSGKTKYMAKRNNGIKCVPLDKTNWCNKHNAELLMMKLNEETVPDIAECKSFE